jgi:hypothetical protein
MVRRIIVLAAVAALAFIIYSNRQQIARLAGLESNETRISGDWYEVRGGFKEDDLYTFSEELISRNGEPVGQYHFRSYSELEVTLDDRTELYTVDFPTDDDMRWYQEVKGERVLRLHWGR